MRRPLLLGLLLIASPAAAEVKSASANAFVIEQRIATPLDPTSLYRRFTDIRRWWDKEHTYSGNSANLSLDLKAGGCFCERLPNGGGIEHMRVIYADPGKRLVMSGALGPLLYEAVTGIMDVQVKPNGQGSELVLTYKAAGFANGGADRLASLVDQVLGRQLALLKASADRP